MKYAKAIVGAALAGLGSAATAVTDGDVTLAEGIAIASTTLLALYGVWQVPNRQPDPVIALADRDARRSDPRM